jgi:hypothetical protein
MTRLKKELLERGILFDAPDCPRCIQDDSETVLVGIDKDYLITVYFSAVLDPILYIYDRYTLSQLATQYARPDDMSFGRYFNKWGSNVLGE